MTTSSVFLNGSFVERDHATISAFDAGFQHGIGLFETMLAFTTGEPTDDLAHISVVGLQAHLDRLATSAKALSLVDRLNTEGLAEAIVQTVAKSELRRARVRLTVTGGDLNMLERSGSRAGHDPTILITTQPATNYPLEMFEKGVLVTIADWRTNPLDAHAGHKTLNYWPRLRELQIAGGKNAAEALVLQVTNHVAGGCVSNLCLIKDGVLITPTARGEEADGALPSPVLPGTTRARVIEAANELGIDTQTQLVSIDDVLDADEAFLTNASWGVLPIAAVEAQPVGEGKPGPLTGQLRSVVRKERGEEPSRHDDTPPDHAT